MKNWLGQDILVGDWVYRGARDGNTSSFKVGRVIKITEEKRTAYVHWLYEPSVRWNAQRERERIVKYLDSKGSPDIDSLVKLDNSIEELLESQPH